MKKNRSRKSRGTAYFNMLPSLCDFPFAGEQRHVESLLVVTWLDGEPAPVLSPVEGEGLGEDGAHRHHLLILRLVHPSLKING
jgi:hypothetical protein